MSVRVIHGANEGFFDLQNQTVRTVRKALTEVFNIPKNAVALIDGEPVVDESGIGDGDVLEFVRELGMKGLGSLMTPDELRERWKIGSEDYEELLILGLPILRFGNGGVRHPETAVDEFFRQLGDRNRPVAPELVGSPYIAGRLGCTTVWVTEMVRSGSIPPICVVPGTGNGKPWKFFRVRINEWLARR